MKTSEACKRRGLYSFDTREMIPVIMGEIFFSWVGSILIGEEPKLTSSALSNPTIYQTSITKLLDLEALNPYLKNFPKEDGHD